MNLRLWTLAAFLVSAALAAGCTSGNDPASPTPDDGATPPPNTQPGTGGTPAPKPSARPEPIAEAGDIQGAFDKAWTLSVPSVGARGMTVWFNLSGLEADAPPTARVTLRLLDDEGNAVESAVLGVGGDADAIEWRLTGVDIAEPGTYKLEATAETPAGALPSFGLAKYQLYAFVEY